MKIRILPAIEPDTACVSCGQNVPTGTECIRDLTLGSPTIPTCICLSCVAAMSAALLGSSAPTHVVPPPSSALHPTRYTWKCPTESCGAEVTINWNECVWCGTARPTEASTECTT